MTIGKYKLWVEGSASWQLGILFRGYRVVGKRSGNAYMGGEIALPIFTIYIDVVKKNK